MYFLLKSIYSGWDTCDASCDAALLKIHIYCNIFAQMYTDGSGTKIYSTIVCEHIHTYTVTCYIVYTIANVCLSCLYNLMPFLCLFLF